MNKEMFFKMFKNQNFVEQLKEIPQKFNVVHNEEEKTSEITIYGVIGSSWYQDSFSATDIDNALNAAGDNDIIIHLNSPGGDAFDGIAIYNRLRRHEGTVTVHVDGWACSAASLFPMAADNVIMGLGSMLMIHEASNIVWGSKTDMRKEAEVLEQLEDGIIDIYMTKANISREEIRSKVDAETWMSAKTALELGFANVAEGVESGNKPTNNQAPMTTEQKKNVLGDLQNILKPNEKPKEPEQKPANKQNLSKLFLNL